MSSLLDQILANLGNAGKNTGNFVSQQAQAFAKPIVNTGNNLGGAFAAIGQQQNAAALRQKTQLIARQYSDQLAANPKLYDDKKFLSKMNADLNSSVSGLKTNSSTLMRNNITTVNPTQAAGDAAQTALTIGTMGLGSLFKAPVAGALSTVAKQGLGAAAKQYGKQLAGSAAENGIYGGAYGAASTASDNPNASLSDYAKNIAAGAGLGAATSVALPLAGVVAKKGAQAGIRAVGDATQASHDKVIDKVASSIGESVAPHHSLFDGGLVKAASPDDLKGAEKYFNQIKKGKDIGPITTTRNEAGAIEPVTKEGLQKYLAYKAAYEQKGASQPSHNDFGGTNIIDNPYKNVPTKQIDSETLQNGLSAYKARSESGSVGLTRNDELDQLSATQPKAPLPYGTTSAQNSLTRGAKEGRQNVSDEVAQAVQGEHVVRNTKALDQRGTQAAEALKSPQLYEEATNRMQVKSGTIGDEDVSFINQAIERADKEGNHDVATQLHDQLAEHLVANGQTSQAAILLYNRTPQGLLNKAVRDINKSTEKGHVTPELRKELQDLTDAIKNAPNQEAKEIAVARLQKRVQNEIPKGKLQGAVSVWKAGLLSGPLTHAGNILSNGTFGTLNKISDIPAAAIDKGLSLFTGKRTKTFTTEGLASGALQGAKNAGITLKSGIDKRNIIDGKYEGHGELNFKNPVIQKVFGDTSNGVFRLLGASDQPFYYAAAKNSLYDQAKAAVKTEKIPRAEQDTFVKDFVDNPSKQAAQQAENDAKTAVLGEDNVIGSAVSKFTQAHPALQALVPFTKVPTNFIKQATDYTPIGPMVAVFKAAKQIKSGEGFDQRALSTALGKGATGTSVVALGSVLAGAGALSGQYPSTDQKEAQRWKAEKITPNSIKIKDPLTGQDKWLSLNYFGPVGILLQAGKDLHDGEIKDGAGVADAAAGLGKTLAGQSFLTGLSGVANAVNDPQMSASSFVNSEAGTLIPNLVKTIANATDSTQRQANNIPETLQAGIPGLRTGLNPKTDVYGNTLTQRTDPASLVTNPFRPSDQVHSPTLDEVARLRSADPNNKDLEVTPTPVDKTIKVNGQSIKLTDQQRYDLQKQIGQTTQTRWGQLIQTPEYQALNDTDKAKALSNLRSDSTVLAQNDFVQSNGLASSGNKLTNNQKNLVNGSTSLSSYAKDSTASTGSSSLTLSAKLDSTSKSTLTQYSNLSTADRDKKFYSDPSSEYQYDLAKYKNDVANGSLTTAQTISQKSNLAKEAVGSTFSKDIRDLYSLSKSQLYSYVSTDPNGNSIAQQVIAYGDALQSAGVADNKFRSSTGAVTLNDGTSSSSASKASYKAASNTATLSAYKTAKNAKIRKVSSSKGKSRGLIAYKKPAKAKEFKA